MASVPGVQGAAPPPPGVMPDFANPVDVLHTVNLVAQILSIVLVSVFVLLRVYAKAVLAPPFLLDDCTFLPLRFVCPRALPHGEKLVRHLFLSRCLCELVWGLTVAPGVAMQT